MGVANVRRFIALVLAASLFVSSAFALDGTYDVTGDAVTLFPVQGVYVGSVAQQAAQAAADAGIMPIAESTWTNAQWNNIYDAITGTTGILYQTKQISSDTASMRIDTLNIKSNIQSIRDDLRTVQGSVASTLSQVSYINNGLGYSSYLGHSVARDLNDIISNQGTIYSGLNSVLSEILTSIQDNGSNTGSLAHQTGFSSYGNSLSTNQTFADALFSISGNQIYNSEWGYLSSTGLDDFSSVGLFSSPYVSAIGFRGLASILRGVDGTFDSSYTGSLWSYADSQLTSSEYSVSGGFPMIHLLLDSIGMGTYQLVEAAYDNTLLSKQIGFSYFGNSFSSNDSLVNTLMAISGNQIYNSEWGYLSSAGSDDFSSLGLFSTAYVDAVGFRGLANILRGSDNLPYTGSLWSFDSDGELASQSYSVSGGFPMINTLLDNMNGGLYRLVNVLASPLDEKISDAAREDQEAFNENFQGDGEGSSKGSVGSAAGISSGFSDTFSTGANPGQFFSGINDNVAFWFSQEVKDSMRYNGPQMMDLDGEEEFINFYELNREEFYSLLGGGLGD